MNDKLLKSLAGTFIALLLIGFSPLVDSDTGWKNTLGGIVWWSIIALGTALLVLGAIAYRARRAHQ